MVNFVPTEGVNELRVQYNHCGLALGALLLRALRSPSEFGVTGFIVPTDTADTALEIGTVDAIE